MTKANEREQAMRIEDLENALKAIGRILADGSHPIKQRVDQAIGILKMFDCAPVAPDVRPS